VFSGAQLNETMPNTTDLARYSIDFRTSTWTTSSQVARAIWIRAAPVQLRPVCCTCRRTSLRFMMTTARREIGCSISEIGS
jgi:hypothetical protein